MITDINPPDREPVTLEAVKLFLRLDHDDEDSFLLDLIRSAREQLETLCGTSLIERSRRLTLTPPLSRCLTLNVSPVSALTGLTLHLQNGEEESLSLDQLSINLRANPATVSLKTLGLWGWHKRQDIAAITVDVISGYGPDIDDIPMPLRQALLLLIGQGYEHRSGRDMPSITLMVDALIMPYRSLKL